MMDLLRCLAWGQRGSGALGVWGFGGLGFRDLGLGFGALGVWGLRA